MECVDDLRKCVLRFLLLMEQMNRNGFCLRYVRFVLCAFGRCFICRILSAAAWSEFACSVVFTLVHADSREKENADAEQQNH